MSDVRVVLFDLDDTLFAHRVAARLGLGRYLGIPIIRTLDEVPALVS
jgi:FMN phosphatase YigB (HAD superfamily)